MGSSVNHLNVSSIRRGRVSQQDSVRKSQLLKGNEICGSRGRLERMSACLLASPPDSSEKPTCFLNDLVRLCTVCLFFSLIADFHLCVFSFLWKHTHTQVRTHARTHTTQTTATKTNRKHYTPAHAHTHTHTHTHTHRQKAEMADARPLTKNVCSPPPGCHPFASLSEKEKSPLRGVCSNMKSLHPAGGCGCSQQRTRLPI